MIRIIRNPQGGVIIIIGERDSRVKTVQIGVSVEREDEEEGKEGRREIWQVGG
jgi:hypothetical protein